MINYFNFILVFNFTAIVAMVLCLHVASTMLLFFKEKNTYNVFIKPIYSKINYTSYILALLLYHFMIKALLAMCHHNHYDLISSFDTVVMLIILTFVLLWYIDLGSETFDYKLFILVTPLFNIMFYQFQFMINLILIELISYMFFFLFCRFMLFKSRYKNYIVIYYNIIINFVSTILLVSFVVLTLWKYGCDNVLIQSLVYKSNPYSALMVSAFLIKIGLVPFFFYKFSFYKFLPLNLVFFIHFITPFTTC